MSVPAAPAEAPHIPVLLDEVLAGLDPRPGDVMVDGTFGAGGYTRALMKAGARVVAFDRDPAAIAAGSATVAASDGQLILVPDLYSAMAAGLAAHGIDRVDGVTLDVGVSSMQLDQAERGFSFQADGPLDMRMGSDGPTAADVVNGLDEAELADLLFLHGEERQSRRVARAIVAARPLTRTGELAAVVRRALGHRPHEKKDPATRTFQALRIHVNRELDELADGLHAAERVLKPGGRLAVVSFHSLEDRLVKRFLRERSTVAQGSRHLPDAAVGAAAPSFDQVARAVRPAAAEEARNPRSRSATLRVARRTAASPWAPSQGRRFQ